MKRRGISIWIFRSKLPKLFVKLDTWEIHRSWVIPFARWICLVRTPGWDLLHGLGSHTDEVFHSVSDLVVFCLRSRPVVRLTWFVALMCQRCKSWRDRNEFFVCSCHLLLLADLSEQNIAKYLLVQFKCWLTSHQKVFPLPFLRWDFYKDWKSPQIEVSAMEWHRFSRSVVLKPPAPSRHVVCRLYAMQTISLCCKIENY